MSLHSRFSVALLLSGFLFLPPVGAASEPAWIQLCGPDRPSSLAANYAIEYLQIDGSHRWLVLSDSEDEDCARLALPVPPSEVRWMGLISNEKFERLSRGVILQGVQTEHRLQVSEIVVAQPSVADRVPLPLAMDLFGRLNPRTYGVEARAAAVLTGSTLALRCGPGERPAGVVLRRDGVRLPHGISTNLQLGYQADRRFSVGYADGAAHALEDPHPLGDLPASPGAGNLAETVRLPLPGVSGGDLRSLSESASSTVAFTFMCPQAGGELTLTKLQLGTSGIADSPPRSIWIWQPSEWLNHPEPLLEELASLSTPVVYISVPIEGGRVLHAESLSRFIGAAHTRDVQVWAVEGDPHAVLPDGQAAFAERARALMSFNADQPTAQRLSGVQYDIEPYLLPDFALHTEEWLVAYVQTIHILNNQLEIPLEIAVPFWWSSLEVDGGPLLDALAPHVQGVNVMNYRTDPAQIQQFAEPFLAWGARQGIAVRIALEAGPIADEQRWHFRRAGEGARHRLWQTQIAGEPLLILLQQPAAVPQGNGYQYVRESRFDGSRLTFKGDLARMDRLMVELESLWRAWPSFAGLALHEYRLQGE